MHEVRRTGVYDWYKNKRRRKYAKLKKLKRRK
jgi:hypothetical protein